MSQIQKLLNAKKDLQEIDTCLRNEIFELRQAQLKSGQQSNDLVQQAKDKKLADLEKALELERANMATLVKERARNKERIQNMRLEMEDKDTEYQARELEHRNQLGRVKLDYEQEIYLLKQENGV